MQRSPVLVLGATGACGRHVVDFLAAQPSVTVRAATRLEKMRIHLHLFNAIVSSGIRNQLPRQTRE